MFGVSRRRITHMKILYIADDGKQFEDEYECINYEFRILHPHLKTIELYDRFGKKINKSFR